MKEQFEGHLTGGKAASFTPDGSRLITGASGWDAIRIWDVETWRSLLTLAADGVFISPVQFSEDGNLVGALDTGMNLHLWQAPSWVQIEEAERQNLFGLPEGFDFVSPDTFISGYESGLFAQGLTDQESVERVSVVPGEIELCLAMLPENG